MLKAAPLALAVLAAMLSGWSAWRVRAATADVAALLERQERIAERLLAAEARMNARLESIEREAMGRASEVNALLEWHKRNAARAATAPGWSYPAPAEPLALPTQPPAATLPELLRRELAAAGVETTEDDAAELLRLLRLTVLRF